ncbi:MAG: hypothetical protein J7639_04210 [Paenibacillaceae bacterium]|nr:hypothetical protein [Paenibacillaceae bacterium]
MEDRIVLPERLFMLAGDGERIEQFNLYYRNAVIDLAPDEHVNIICAYGRQFRDFWRLEPGNAAQPFDAGAAAAGEFPLRLQVFDRTFALVAEKTTQIVIVPMEEKEETKLLGIGDSITRNGDYIGHARQALHYVRTVGTRTYDGGEVKREGRGGWTAEMYNHRTGAASDGDSPFLFPAGNPEATYWGNTSFWKHVVSVDPTGYAYDGYQLAARQLGDPNLPYTFGEDGYPLAPAVGDIACDPELGDVPLREWDGERWRAMEPQPEWEFDFGRYLRRFGVPQPDIVSILFGSNEFMPLERAEDGLDSFLHHIQLLVDSVKRHDPKVRIILNLPLTGAGQDAWGRSGGCNRSEARHRRNMQQVARAMLRRWDNDEAREQGIRICPLLLVVDPEHGFSVVNEPVSKYVAKLVERPSDWVHPNRAGHCQMGDTLAAVIQSID